MFSAKVKSVAASSFLALPACGGPKPAGEGGGGTPEAEGVEVWCKYKDETSPYKYLCIEENNCLGTNAANVCSMFFSGDVDHADLWMNSTLMGPCNDGIGPEPENPQAPCICDHGSVINEQICDVPPELGEFDYPDGYPIPGDDPTGEEDVTTGEEPTLKSYVCGNPLAVQARCVFYNHVVDPLLDDEKICWVDPQQPDDYTICISATDDANALVQCTDKCNDEFLPHAAAEIAAHVPADEIVEPIQDCVLDGMGEVPRLKVATDTCDPQVNYLLAWGGTSILRPFVAATTLSTSTGGSTSNREILGYIGYESANCTLIQCDFAIDALEGVRQDVAGIFTDAAGAQTSYTIENLDFRLTQGVSGILYLRSHNVVFPIEPFAGSIWASGHSIAGTPMGDWSSPIYVSQAVGSVDSSGNLTLNLTFNWSDGVFNATFVTR